MFLFFQPAGGLPVRRLLERLLREDAELHELERPHGAALRRGVFGKSSLVFGCTGANLCE